MVHREPVDKEFLQIKKSNYYDAYKILGATALALYTYIAGNADGYSFALSPAGVQKGMGMPESTARDQINRLIACGYLVQRGDSNIFDFHERPLPKEQAKEEPPELPLAPPVPIDFSF